MAQWALLFALASSIPQVAVSTSPGALKLDNYTIDKMLAFSDTSVLVKFDKSYAYGEQEDEFKVLCKLAYEVKDFLVGEVPVQEYGDKENDDLRERYKVSKEDFPVFFLFDKNHKDGLRYTGAVKADMIASWLRKNQVKMPSIGTIAELDELVKKFLKNGMADSEIESAKKLAAGEYSSDRKAAMYVKTMLKTKEKGDAYVETETKRVYKLLEGKLTAEKTSELNEKLKVLGAFSRDEL